MKKNGKIFKGISVIVTLIAVSCCLLIISNCTKKGEDKSIQSPVLKSDTIHVSSSFSWLPQDSLSLIKRKLGSTILLHLQKYWNKNLTDFNILTDTIKFSNDTCKVYCLNISYLGCLSKQLAYYFSIGDTTQTPDYYVITHIWTCSGTCTSCQMRLEGGYGVCTCPGGGGGTCSIHETNFYWWFTN
jgi:hypothetical protein